MIYDVAAILCDLANITYVIFSALSVMCDKGGGASPSAVGQMHFLCILCDSAICEI